MPQNFLIRPANDSEMPSCREWLPEAFGPDFAPEMLVAVPMEDPAQLVGACALSWCNAPKPEVDPSGFPMMLHVVEAMRRKGVGRALIEGAASWCRDETTALRNWMPVPAGSDAALFLGQSGFSLHHRTLHFEANLSEFHRIVDHLRDRLQCTGRMPTAARLLRLHDVPAWDVAALVAPEFPAPHAAIMRRLTPGAPDAFDLARSVALLVGDVLAGVLIFSWNGGEVGIEVIVVAPSFRGGAANVLLLEGATRAAMEGGAKVFRFYCDERTRDTIGLARRAGSTPRRIDEEWRRALA